MGQRITVVEGYYEEVKLKLLECSSCGSGSVLYDSRDQERISQYSPALLKLHNDRVAEKTKA